MQIAHRLVTGALVLLLFAGGTATAEDDTTTFETRRKSLPAPSDKHGFSQDFTIAINGQSLATATLSATPTPGDKPGWQIRERVTVKIPQGPTQQRDMEAILDATLLPLEGAITESGTGDAPTKHTWKRGDKTIVVTMTTEGVQGRRKTIEDVGPSIHGMTSILLFARMVMPEGAGTWETRALKPEFNVLVAERPYEATTIQLDAKAQVGGKAAWTIRATKGDKVLEVVLDPASRAVLSIKGTSKGGPTLLFTPKAKDRSPQLDATVFGQPAKSAVAAALRAAYALKTADVEVMDAVAHWPSIRKGLGDRVPAAIKPERFAEVMRQSFKSQVKAVDTPDKATKHLLSIQGELTTKTLEGGNVEVTFPEGVTPKPLVVREIDGVWRLVEFPMG